MITDILMTFIIMPLQILSPILQGITNFAPTIVPNQIYSSIDTVISYLGYFNGIFPIDTLIFCIQSLTSFYLIFYATKIMLWMWSFVPILGLSSKINLPSGSGHRSASSTRINS